MNPYTGRPFSDRYFDILRKRIELPVWEYRENFFNTFKDNKVFVLVGETGSGKTTQVNIFSLSFDRSRLFVEIITDTCHVSAILVYV